MRTSSNKLNEGLASAWPLVLVRAGGALLLSLSLILSGLGDGVGRTELGGGLGLFAITDGVLASLIAADRPHARAFVYEGVVCVALGLGVLQLDASALALLVFVATRALVAGGSELSYALTHKREPGSLWLLLAAGVSSLVGLGFCGVAAFGYDALDLASCIAGYSGIVGALMLMLGWKLRSVRERGDRHASDGYFEHRPSSIG